MKKLMTIAALVVAVGLSGCSVSPIEEVPSGNAELKVELIGVVDGIRLYRFADRGYTRYFASSGRVYWTETNGKTQVPMSIETVPVKEVE